MLNLTYADFADGTGNNAAGISHVQAFVPFPVVGAGLPGLVLACGGLLALARRRVSSLPDPRQLLDLDKRAGIPSPARFSFGQRRTSQGAHRGAGIRVS